MAIDTGSAGVPLSVPRRAAHSLRRHLGVVLTAVYFIVAATLMVRYGMWMTPEKLIILGLVVALFAARPVAYVRDWTPVILLLLGYEFLRGIAYTHGLPVNIWFMIDADRFLFFGELPPVWLQDHLLDPNRLFWWDYLSTLLYMSHTILPFGFAYYLWSTRRTEFKKFVTTLLVLSYAGFLTYLLYPAMPPWMAAKNGYIPEIHSVIGRVLGHLGNGPHLPSIYDFANPNPVAAMPSLHSAYPFLVFLFAVRIWGRRAVPFILYPAAVWFSIVYTGNHYVVDIIAGVLYATVFFFGGEWLWRRRERRREEREASAAAEVADGNGAGTAEVTDGNGSRVTAAVTVHPAEPGGYDVTTGEGDDGGQGAGDSTRVGSGDRAPGAARLPGR